jgi:hypothetical protein
LGGGPVRCLDVTPFSKPSWRPSPTASESGDVAVVAALTCDLEVLTRAQDERFCARLEGGHVGIRIAATRMADYAPGPE